MIPQCDAALVLGSNQFPAGLVSKCGLWRSAVCPDWVHRLQSYGQRQGPLSCRQSDGCDTSYWASTVMGPGMRFPWGCQ